jgi:coatomer subunit beta'
MCAIVLMGNYSLVVFLCRLYLGDKELNVVSYSLLLSVLEYQTAVMRGDFETADRVLPTIPRNQRTRVAHFLEKQVSLIFL